ncbi:WecB/TagA/CpsF family glycosyltransferase [Kineococcus sp. T13]|uniref:WecB/TagA/CpsF family glycosyltransferase n=1 Tax=Kineococcus vitellinus TaxID=2696565 RepID=UPI001412ED5E|nr:WecB/TagA/CpsF family glycosyltransferase [Kineococcus vitellinus]NAZ75759.1 WecB/TagA/CpsF family glycosyltransferase [Kineococcus vitellinus]
MALDSSALHSVPSLRSVNKGTRTASTREETDPSVVRQQITVDDVAFDALREEEVVAHVMAALDAGRGGNLITPNVDILRQLRRPQLRDLAEQAELVVPDGMPIVWASRLQGEELPERVTGSSLIWSLSEAAAEADRTLYLLGGAEGIAERAADRLTGEFDGLRMAGWDCPPFGFERDARQLEQTVGAVVDAKPDIVFVALGFPKQERLMQLLREHLPSTWFIGCGGTLTMVAGEVSRAPEWIQRSGLEWVHRLAMEPRRMAKRYLVHDLPYAAGLMARSVARRTSARRAA